MLASSGEATAPCGVPTSVFDHFPSSEVPALSHFWIRRRIRRGVAEQLAPDFVRMHQAGLIRGIASALDCLAGVIIGVAALPQSILKADFKQARAVLARVDGTASAGAKAQADFAAQLEAAIAHAGPLGWIEWTLDLRNMLVHRGHRIELGQYLPITPVLLGPDGNPAPPQPLSRARFFI